MFRSRFTDVMPSKLPHFGPQDVERGVSDSAPSHEVQQLLCAILGLVLNRKKPVEYVLPNTSCRCKENGNCGLYHGGQIADLVI